MLAINACKLLIKTSMSHIYAQYVKALQPKIVLSFSMQTEYKNQTNVVVEAVQAPLLERYCRYMLTRFKSFRRLLDPTLSQNRHVGLTFEYRSLCSARTQLKTWWLCLPNPTNCAPIPQPVKVGQLICHHSSGTAVLHLLFAAWKLWTAT